jgi:predicted phosphate transport protein (TIGR00153 family)
MRLLPQAKVFLQQFQEQSRILVESSELLLQGVRAGAERYGNTPGRIEQLEREADEIVHAIADELNCTFITPYDPEDIHALASGLDDIIDELEEAAHRIGAYRVYPIPPVVVELAEILDDSAHAVQDAVTALASHDDNAVAAKCIEIDRLEAEADILMREAVERLFVAPSDAIALMKVKEIYELMEEAIDRCEDVADTLRNVVVKGG